MECIISVYFTSYRNKFVRSAECKGGNGKRIVFHELFIINGFSIIKYT